MKRVSWLWALLVGILSVMAQVIIFYVRFGRWNVAASITDYVLLFVAGALGGSILVFFLNHQASTVARRAVLIAFLLASPIALLMMILGGLLGWIGVLIYPQIPWALFTWFGSWERWSQATEYDLEFDQSSRAQCEFLIRHKFR